jgi:hypothetical protein
MLTFKQKLAEDAKYEIYYDKTASGWSETRAISAGLKMGYELFGIAGTSNTGHFFPVLFEPNAYDKTLLRGVPVKSGHKIFRYITNRIAGTMMPFILVNMKSGSFYFLSDESANGDIDEVVFKKKVGGRFKFMRILDDSKPGF